MQPVISDVRGKSIFALCFIFLTGLGVVAWPYLLHSPHRHHNTFDLWLGGIFMAVSILAILGLKKVIIDGNGIHVEYYIGRKLHYRFDEIVHITAKMNMNTSIGFASSDDRNNQLILTPGAGKQRFVINSNSMSHFTEMFAALQSIYGTRMEIVNKR